jgi:hypothetical protein
MSEPLRIGLDAWVIQDGNYGDFGRGQRRAFALEFHPALPLAARYPDAPLERRITWRKANRYEVRAVVTHAAPDWWVMDAGIELYSTTSLPPCAPGASVKGEIHISIDHFGYFESWAKAEDAPALIHDWHIDRVELETTPWLEPRPRYFERDATREAWRDVPATKAWNHDGGRANYILTATRLSAHGRHSL